MHIPSPVLRSGTPVRALVLALVLVLILAACERAPAKPTPPGVAQAMPELPVPPNGELIGRSGSVDALQLIFQSDAGMDVIAGFYRDVFTSGGWNLVSDSKDRNGAVMLYAEKNGHPMWVRMSPAGTATRIEVTGAVPGADSAFAARAKIVHDSTNTMVPVTR